MFLKSLNLTNFRNYTSLDLTFSKKPTIFIGPNGAGKSNILEAIYLLSTTKSPRVELETELIKEDNNFFNVKGILDGQVELLISVVEEEGLSETSSSLSKRVMVNGVGRRVVDFIGQLPAVIFWPSDINMVTGSPSLRRWHLDLTLAQIDPQYKKALTLYEQILYSRNRVLKRIREEQGKLDELTYWTDQLIEKGEIITSKRQQFFEFINQLQNPLGNFKFEYKQSLPFSDEKGKPSELLDREIAAAQTLIGPHRDDFRVILNASEGSLDSFQNKSGDSSPSAQNDKSRDMAHFGSRGEQRMATLAFKLATLEYMSKVLGKRPILLLDDVFSELDTNHRAQVAEIAKLQQTIIATVELENIPQDFLDSSSILQVEDGKIMEGIDIFTEA